MKMKRGPGRPPGSKNKRRGPGRPPGSKNKRRAPKTLAVYESMAGAGYVTAAARKMLGKVQELVASIPTTDDIKQLKLITEQYFDRCEQLADQVGLIESQLKELFEDRERPPTQILARRLLALEHREQVKAEAHDRITSLQRAINAIRNDVNTLKFAQSDAHNLADVEHLAEQDGPTGDVGPSGEGDSFDQDERHAAE